MELYQLFFDINQELQYLAVHGREAEDFEDLLALVLLFRRRILYGQQTLSADRRDCEAPDEA